MMTVQHTTEQLPSNPRFLNLTELAMELGPHFRVGWLRKQTNAGSIPCLRVGNRTLYDPTAVRVALAVMAQQHSPKVKPKS